MEKFDPISGEMKEQEEEPVAPPSVAPVTPAPPAPTVPPAAPTPAAPPAAPKTTTAPAPTPAPAPAGLELESKTIVAPRVEGKVVDANMKAADKEVAAATDQAALAIQKENENRVKQAEVDTLKLDIEKATKARESKEAAERLAASMRQRKALEDQVAREQGEFDAAAKDTRTFFSDKSTGQKILWSLSILFGAGGTEKGNVGVASLDKAMDEWKGERDKKLATLEKRALASKGLLAKFWQDNAAEARAQKELQDAAGHAAVANLFEQQIEKTKHLLTETAIAVGMSEIAKHRQAAADKRAAVVEGRAKTMSTGGGTTTFKAPAGPGEGKPVPEHQAKALGWLASMENDAKIIESLPPMSERARRAVAEEMSLKSAMEKNPGVDYTARLLNIRKNVESSFSEDEQRVYNAATSFLDPLVRSRTGAVVGASEWENKLREAFPAPGDKPKAVSDKRTRRASFMREIGVRTPHPDEAMARIDAIYGPGAAPAASSASDIVDVRDKRTGAIIKARKGADGKLYPVAMQ